MSEIWRRKYTVSDGCGIINQNTGAVVHSVYTARQSATKSKSGYILVLIESFSFCSFLMKTLRHKPKSVPQI